MRLYLLAAVAALTVLAAAASPAGANVLRKANATSITVSDEGKTAPAAGTPYPSQIAFSGITGRVTGVRVRLDDVNHTFPDDIDVLLVGPNGRGVMLMSDVGNSNDLTNVDLVFDDAAGVSVPDATIPSGTYKPTDVGTGDVMPAPAPAGPYAGSLGEAFGGSDPNGSWSLYAVDDTHNDFGKIAGGWTLTLLTGRVDSSSSPITITDRPTGGAIEPSSPYPSAIDVSGADGTVARVAVQLHGFSHQDPGDVDIVLQAPNGALTTLMSDAGGSSDVSDLELRFDDNAPTAIGDSGTQLQSGSYRPANLGGDDVYPDPGPTSAPGDHLFASEGSGPNGQWRLYVVDDASAGKGSIAGWSLELTLHSRVHVAGSPSAAESAGTKTITIKRTTGGDAAKVHYEISDPDHARDVKPASGDLSFAPGQRNATVKATIFNDSGDEPDESIPVKLTSVSGDVAYGEEVGYLQILDDDRTDARDDFNGDGAADQAIGVPDENLAAGADAGAVQVMYGSDGGLGTTKNQRFTQDTTGMPDVAEKGDRFGAALAAGDFNGDGYGDLAIGAPGEDDSGLTDMGRVTVLYGSSTGLKTAGAQIWGQGSPGVPGDNQTGDRFGAALAAGNVGHGDRSDLAIGAPGESVATHAGAGAVTVLYGGAGGVDGAGAGQWTQNSAGVLQAPENGDGFGSRLAIGDFGRGAERDLAVGVPAENGGRGVVQVLYGTTATGIAAAGNTIFSQDTDGFGAVAEAGDHFGAALAVGDLSGDRADELTIGAPDEDLDGAADAGQAHLAFGSAAIGLDAQNGVTIDQSSSSVNTGNGAGDHFGSAMAIGQFGGESDSNAHSLTASSAPDLAIGVPGETFGAASHAGAVEIVYGDDGSHGDKPAPMQFHQGDASIPDSNETGDRFGASLAGGRYSSASTLDGLVVGIPGEKLGTAAAAGALDFMPPQSSGGVNLSWQRYAQGADGMLDAAEADDHFGAVLTP